MDLSVIVPVFNVKNYLVRCLKSLLAQSFNCFEIILIDDGSTDGSKFICDEYAKNNSVISVYHKDNGGLSDARNFGLKRSRGIYVAFLDSDDYVIPEAYEKLICSAKKNEADVVIARSCNFVKDTVFMHKPKISLPDEVFKGSVFLAKALRSRGMVMCAPYGVYKRSLILENDLYFKCGILHEDELWTPQVLLAAERVKYLDLEFYMHYQREGSITLQNDKTQNGIDLVNICFELADVFDEKIQNDLILRICNDRLVMLYLSAIYIGKLWRKEYSTLLNKKFLRTRAFSIKNKLKTNLFCLSPKLYCLVNSLSKHKKIYNRLLKS